MKYCYSILYILSMCFQITVCSEQYWPQQTSFGQRMHSWYTTISPYIDKVKSAWKRTPEIVGSAEPFMPEEGYEVAMKPEYAPYRQMPVKGLQFIYSKAQEKAKPLIQTYTPRIQQAKRTFGTLVQQMIERDLSLDRIKAHYKDPNEYLEAYPDPRVQAQYKGIKEKKSPMQKVHTEALAVQTEVEDQHAINTYTDKIERILNFAIRDRETLTKKYEILKQNLMRLDEQVKTGKLGYGEAQYYKKNMLAQVYNNLILPAYAYKFITKSSEE